MSVGWEAFERAGWESRVGPYHRFFAPVSERLVPGLLELASLGAGTDVLDLCCGPGYVAAAASALGASAHGVDISVGMVELARRLVPGATFVVGDAQDLPYGDASFDAVVCNFGLHHLADPRRAIAECARVLRPGGRFVTSVWDEDINDLAIVPDAVYAAGAVAPADIPTPPPQPAYVDGADVAALLAGSGLMRVDTRVLECSPVFASTQELWDGWLAAAIRTGPVLAAQSPAIQRRARELFDLAVAKLVRADGSVQAQVRIAVLITERLAARAAGPRGQ